METVFTVPTAERHQLKTKEKVLSALDRCDSCGAQAYVRVTGFSGELSFCSHHYNKIMSSTSGKEAMEKFAYETVDERNFVK
jgi:ribulose bisphosphate carboxylase small subunit